MQRESSITYGQSVAIFAISLVSLAVALWLVSADLRRGILTAAAAVVAISLIQVIFQPVLRLISRHIGLIGIAFVGLLSSTILVWLALSLIPGIQFQHWWSGLLAAWLYALLITLVQWLLISRSDDIFLQEILRTNRRLTHSAPTHRPGFVFIQLDGVSKPILDWQLMAGNLPNIARLINDEGYNCGSWRAQLPSTTPASQAGILLGSNRDIPGFRWYEKKTGRLIVANEPDGAAIIEQRHGNGRGLLADGGVSIGNLFSGDAAVNIMVMSKLSGNKESLRHMPDYTAYFSSPFGYMRSFVLAIGEACKEVYQAHRQAALDIRPRIQRRAGFIVQRVGTNVLLRYLQTYIIVKNMLKGTNSLYADFLDYDEIAHHAGIARPEALDALSGIDRVIGIVARARRYAPRPYTIILLSDHGQSQGTTFKQLHDGRSLESIVAGLTETSVVAATEPVEIDAGYSTFGDKVDTGMRQPEATSPGKTVVTGSGNLAGIWFTGLPGQATLQDINKRHPRLIDRLLETEGIGLVLARSATRGPLCISANGEMTLADGKISGSDPLSTYNSADRESLLRLAGMRSAPDLAVIAAYQPNSGETYAFEELVGNHGSIGGWQREAILLYPPALQLPGRYQKQPIIGAENLHRILKQWMLDAG